MSVVSNGVRACAGAMLACAVSANSAEAKELENLHTYTLPDLRDIDVSASTANRSQPLSSVERPNIIDPISFFAGLALGGLVVSALNKQLRHEIMEQNRRNAILETLLGSSLIYFSVIECDGQEQGPFYVKDISSNEGRISVHLGNDSTFDIEAGGCKLEKLKNGSVVITTEASDVLLFSANQYSDIRKHAGKLIKGA